MSVAPEYPEILLNIAEFLAARLERVGFSPDDAAEIGWRLAEQLRHQWGGQQLYVPKGLEFELSSKYLRIWERWKAEGFTVDLCRDEELTMRRVRQIVNLVRSQRRQKAEIRPLFEDEDDGDGGRAPAPFAGEACKRLEALQAGGGGGAAPAPFRGGVCARRETA